ncbi:MAG: EAL domain-containing protein [Pseudomonadota bacterium]
MTHPNKVVPIRPATPDCANRYSVEEVRAALREGRMELHYQPQYCLNSGRTVAAEALARLRDRNGELVYPDRFIEELEHHNLIVEFGRAVIARACEDLKTLRSRQLPGVRVAVNLAANQLNLDCTLADFVTAELNKHGLEHGDIEFELTERQGFSAASPGASQLVKLASRGSRVVLDDFGVGYACAASLRDLPFSAIKIDRLVLQDTARSEVRLGMLEGVLALASRLGLEVIAEGIETIDQEQTLKTLGFRWGQGFGYAMPMQAESLMNFLSDEVQWPASLVLG